MFKNFSSLDHRFYIPSILLQTLLPQKKKKKKKKKKHFFRPLFSALHRTYPSKTKQNKTKTKTPLNKQKLFTSLHTLAHLWILLSAKGGTLGKCSYWEGLAYELKSQISKLSTILFWDNVCILQLIVRGTQK